MKENSINLVTGTLRESSIDDNGNYLLDSGEEIVYLLDKIAPEVENELEKGLFLNKNRTSGKGKQKKSVDAVVTKEDKSEVYFIEFKNTVHTHMPYKELFYKTPDSVFIYLYAFEPEISLEQFRNKAIYIVVYNDNAPCRQKENESKSFEKFKEKMQEHSKIESDLNHVLWHLDDLEGKLFKKVYTVEKEVFLEELKQLIW